MRPRAAATSKMERFVIIVNGFKPLTVITKRSILDVSAALHPPLVIALHCNTSLFLGGETYKASRLLTELLSDVAKLRPGALANRLPMKRKCAQPFLDTCDGINLNFSLKLQYILIKGDN